ncbi:FHA domain-containing protein [Nocardioides nanhaiensis]|uniref:FHA domain-containing protein n=1 Tax=Nocardioides nanhaiensis TaxID=1476871 RepID=A0ABP8VVR1_9ACTN
MSDAVNDLPTAPTWSYQPGDWFAVVGPRTTLLLPASEKARVVALWQLVDDGAPFGAVLDGLVAQGLSTLAGFALVGSDDVSTTVLLRGTGVRARLEAAAGTVEVDGAEAATWAERRVEGVTALTVTTDSAPAGTRHFAIDAGLVRVARIDRPEAGEEAGAASAQAPSVAAALDAPLESSPLDEHEPDTSAQPSPYADLAAPPPPPSSPPTLPPTAPPPPPPTLPPPPSGPPSTPPPVGPPSGIVPGFGPEEPSDEEIDDRADQSHQPDLAPDEPADDVAVVADAPESAEALTEAMPAVPDDAEQTPAPPSEPDPADPLFGADHDGNTQVGVDPGEFARQKPGIPGQPQAPSVTRPVARLLVSSGETIDVDRVVLVGRAPEARRFTATETPLLVTVPSPLQEISSTHLEVRPGSGADHGSAVVTDLGSTNGTQLVQPGLDPEDLTPGIAVQLIPGAIINLGDGVTIHVTRP